MQQRKQLMQHLCFKIDRLTYSCLAPFSAVLPVSRRLTRSESLALLGYGQEVQHSARRSGLAEPSMGGIFLIHQSLLTNLIGCLTCAPWPAGNVLTAGASTNTTLHCFVLQRASRHVVEYWMLDQLYTVLCGPCMCVSPLAYIIRMAAEFKRLQPAGPLTQDKRVLLQSSKGVERYESEANHTNAQTEMLEVQFQQQTNHSTSRFQYATSTFPQTSDHTLQHGKYFCMAKPTCTQLKVDLNFLCNVVT
jgi:hypothetical protein